MFFLKSNLVRSEELPRGKIKSECKKTAIRKDMQIKYPGTADRSFLLWKLLIDVSRYASENKYVHKAEEKFLASETRHGRTERNLV